MIDENEINIDYLNNLKEKEIKRNGLKEFKLIF